MMAHQGVVLVVRREYLLGGMCAVALLAAGMLFLGHSSAERAREKATESSKSATAAQLPIAQVVLFSSGVGYFQREGTVEGSQRIDLTFPTTDINDLIKSMTLRDMDGGQINAISYDSNVPVERTLQSFAVNLTGTPTFSAILNQARGEKVEVVLQQANATQPGTLSGSIIGVEKKQQQAGKDVVEVECLNLWCADGMRSLKLPEVQRIRFLNAIMESEFKKALETLAQGHDTQKKAVSIQFAGQGKRNVKVGYVIENPIWKTSYRLVLPPLKKEEKENQAKHKEAKPFLQGWAVVENTTDEDWSGIRMALISGRPISFQMNLYDALFIRRPVVEPELFASLRPVTYSGGLDANLARLKDITQMQERMRSLAASGAVSKEGLMRLEEAKKQLENETFGLAAGAAPNGSMGRDARAWKDGKLHEALDLRRGVQSSASAERLGDYFQYTIDHAVTLPRQKSSLLPIVTKDVEGERVSIFNESTHPKFPLLGLVFKNTTGMHLTQGPITVYEGSTYAGDARILDLQKDERRLLSYAIDLGTEVQAVSASDNGVITSVKAIKGILHTTTRIKESKTYTIVNRNDTDRVVMLEHPNRTDFKLTSDDKPWETARDVHRFKVNAPAGKTITYKLSEEKEFASSVVLGNSDDDGIRLIIKQPVTSPAVKKALEQVLALRGKLAETQRELQQVERQLKVITDDQDRLRKNLKEMPPEAVAYKRYLKKFDDQESEIERLQKVQKELQDSEHAQRKEYEKFLMNSW
jgi:hypothetical protein